MTTPPLIYVGKLAFTDLVWLQLAVILAAHPESLEQQQHHISMISYFLSNFIYVWFKFYFQGYHFLFLCCTLIFVDEREPLPSFNYSFL